MLEAQHHTRSGVALHQGKADCTKAAARATQASEASATQQSVTTPQAPTGAASTTSSGTGMVNLQVTGWANVQFASQPKVELHHSKIAGVCAPQPQDSS